MRLAICFLFFVVGSVFVNSIWAADPRAISFREPMTTMKNTGKTLTAELNTIEDGKSYRAMTDDTKVKLMLASRLIEKCPVFVLQPAGKGRSKHVRVVRLTRFSEQEDSKPDSDGFRKVRICDYGTSDDDVDVALEISERK